MIEPTVLAEPVGIPSTGGPRHIRTATGSRSVNVNLVSGASQNVRRPVNSAPVVPVAAPTPPLHPLPLHQSGVGQQFQHPGKHVTVRYRRAQ